MHRRFERLFETGTHNTKLGKDKKKNEEESQGNQRDFEKRTAKDDFLQFRIPMYTKKEGRSCTTQIVDGKKMRGI